MCLFVSLPCCFLFQSHRSAEAIARLGSKPVFLFLGEEFEQKDEFKQLKSLFLGMQRVLCSAESESVAEMSYIHYTALVIVIFPLPDYFRGEALEKIDLVGLDRLISVAACNGKVC